MVSREAFALQFSSVEIAELAAAGIDRRVVTCFGGFELRLRNSSAEKNRGWKSMSAGSKIPVSGYQAKEVSIKTNQKVSIVLPLFILWT